MLVIIQCPQCPTKIKLPATAATATCPKCHHRFEPATDESSMPAWVSPWGLGAFILATLGLLAASLVGEWYVTLVLSAVGLFVVVLGLRATGEARTTTDQVWLTLGGGMSGLILCVTVVFPGLLNNRWAIDFAVPQADPNEQVVVPRDQPRDPGRVLTTEDWVDAATEAIRQDDLLVTVESVRIGPLADRGPTSFVLVHFQFANIGPTTIQFHGFDRDKSVPVLSDILGSSCTFVEQRQRLPASGEPVFGVAKRGGLALAATKYQGYQLVFDTPPSGFKTLKMELPASAWGRKGVYQFLITREF